jgi:site-specific DNA recombinase
MGGSKRTVEAVGYVRISTNEDKQKYGKKVQADAIRSYCKKAHLKLVAIYTDERSGRHLDRPGIQALLAERDRFQVLVVYKIDRLSRSVLDLLKLVREALAGKEVIFIEEGIDQRTKEGRLLLNQLASFAEYERELIVSRIKDGLREARSNGIRLGAKPKYQDFQKEVRRLRGKGQTWSEICKKLGINFRTAKKAYFGDCN